LFASFLLNVIVYCILVVRNIDSYLINVELQDLCLINKVKALSLSS